MVTAYWGRDWPAAIRALEALEARRTDCDGGFVVANRLYGAYLAYGALLEQRDRREEAISAYEAAARYDFTGVEAVERLRRLGVFTPEPPPGCPPGMVSDALARLPEYTPTAGDFVRVQGGRLTLGGERYTVYGINYYPRDYPDWRFLTQMDVESITFELDLIRSSGLNTLRIYLRHGDLFVCPGNGAIPVPENFARLDNLIYAAGMRGFKLILVLNHDADLTVFPLYDSPPHSEQQMTFLVERYRDEPAVMAYDLRDRGDADFVGSEQFTREGTLEWLARTAALIRQVAPDQLVTVGWENDSALSAPLVDFVSFHSFDDIDLLRQEIAILKAATSRPLLLAAVGYNTVETDEFGQRLAFQRVFEAAQRNDLAGWVIWTAFDYPLSVMCIEPDCPGKDSQDNHFGIWNTSYFPKRALDAVEQATGVGAQGN
jgi:hypothetical protein